MNENGTKRREWVKNAAIVFLVIMLILTFFSNTIMNYSLPEVAAQYIMSGSITAKIRGTGTVESGDPYNIQAKETRKVESVMVKAGDTVQKGDVLFVLADKESEELKATQDALDAALLDFELQILSGNVSSSVVNNVQNGNISSVSVYQSRIVAAEAEIEKWEKEIEEIQLAISQLNAVQGQLAVSTPDTGDEEKKLAEAQAAFDADTYKQALDKVAELEAKIAECDKVIEKYKPENNPVIGYEEEVSGADVIRYPIYEVSEEEYLKAVANRAIYVGQRDALQPQLTPEAKENYEKLEKALNEAKTNLANEQNSVTSQSNSVSIQLSNWNLELTDKQKKLSDATAAKNQLLSDIAAELNLGNKLEQINEQREKITELEANAMGATIEAPISGTISSINLTAGQDMTAGSTIATMQPEGKGFTMSFSVTTEQAKRLSPGIQADLVNAWRYDNVVVTLTKIKPDPSNPAQQKLLEFDVTGDVVDGQTLNVSVGNKSATYDMVVPNSAIREDNNGKFILIVESKSSPLGNRYKASRVDVEILASDDTQSAISGAVYGYEFVITTSNKPVEAGQLIRLAEQ